MACNLPFPLCASSTWIHKWVGGGHPPAYHHNHIFSTRPYSHRGFLSPCSSTSKWAPLLLPRVFLLRILTALCYLWARELQRASAWVARSDGAACRSLSVPPLASPPSGTAFVRQDHIGRPAELQAGVTGVLLCGKASVGRSRGAASRPAGAAAVM
jgi:hypothetical protein